MGGAAGGGGGAWPLYYPCGSATEDYDSISLCIATSTCKALAKDNGSVSKQFHAFQAKQMFDTLKN